MAGFIVMLLLLGAVVGLILWALSRPRQSSEEQMVPPSFFRDLLARAGYPATEHNLFAVQEQIGIMFTTKVWQMMEQLGDESDWNRFLARAAYPTRDMDLWPQRVLTGLVAWYPGIRDQARDLPERYAGILLENVGDGGGGFFSGSPDVPLPTATPWKMQGLKQPSARPMLAPR